MKSELIDVAQSYDIASDMEVMSAHRRRSNTAQRLELLKKKKKNNPKIKIEWKDNLHTFSGNFLKNILNKYSTLFCDIILKPLRAFLETPSFLSALIIAYFFYRKRTQKPIPSERIDEGKNRSQEIEIAVKPVNKAEPVSTI